jgi:hypothetical protein
LFYSSELLQHNTYISFVREWLLPPCFLVVNKEVITNWVVDKEVITKGCFCV